MVSGEQLRTISGLGHLPHRRAGGLPLDSLEEELTMDFRFKGQLYTHLEGGYCVKLVESPEGDEVARLYWGPLHAGTACPHYVKAVRESDEFLDFVSVAGAARWVERRRNVG